MSYAARIIRPFQSTPSGGKATGGAIIILGGVYVSIHAFRGEGDALARAAETLQLSFNPRLPGGRRHLRDVSVTLLGVVSIHAFRGEGDSQSIGAPQLNDRFQSTPSGGKAT